jgi:hypothetical protein
VLNHFQKLVGLCVSSKHFVHGVEHARHDALRESPALQHISKQRSTHTFSDGFPNILGVGHHNCANGGSTDVEVRVINLICTSGALIAVTVTAYFAAPA